MRALPLADPGTPDHRSPARFLVWLMRSQVVTLLGGIFFGVLWMSAQAVLPAVIGRAIDAGVTARDTSALLGWAGALLAVGGVQVVAGIVRHRFAVTNWLAAAYTTVQVVTRQVTRLGAELPRRVSTGEVVAIGSSDIGHLGHALDVTARASGAVVSIVLVAVILLQTSLPLALLVLAGVPALLLALGPLLAPLQRRTTRQRELTGSLTNLATDIVGGLRVLLGIGGERVFHRRYVERSRDVRRAGVEVGRVQSWLDSAQVFLPGVLVVLVVWIGARFAVSGRISPGELVAFYGYATFLLIPVRTLTEFANKWIKALVSARRVVRVLALEPTGHGARPAPAPGAELTDPASGVTIRPGRVTAIVADPPEEAVALVDRLGGFAPAAPGAEPTWGGVPIPEVDPAELRSRVVVAGATDGLFSGRLREVLDVRDRGEDAVRRAVETASATDVVAALPTGWDAPVHERGRSFSGGQRQRLVLARALAVDPEVLLLVEPTSAVDAHTEGRIADQLGAHRRGRTTVVTTTSPLVLDRADEVVLLLDGRETARGTHADLLERVPAYRAVVTREELPV